MGNGFCLCNKNEQNLNSLINKADICLMDNNQENNNNKVNENNNDKKKS